MAATTRPRSACSTASPVTRRRRSGFASSRPLLAVARLPAGSASRQAASKLAILEQPGAPFRPLALETGAMIDLAAGHTDATRRTLSLLVADGGAPTSLRERASTMLQALGPAVAADGSAAR